MTTLGSEMTLVEAVHERGRLTVVALAATGDRPVELSTAELAECRCPDFCERDHDVD